MNNGEDNDNFFKILNLMVKKYLRDANIMKNHMLTTFGVRITQTLVEICNNGYWCSHSRLLKHLEIDANTGVKFYF